jgi:hypothetical protein
MGQKGIGLIFLLLGLGVMAADPVISLQCARGTGPDAICRLSVDGFGVIPYERLDVKGVTGATESATTGLDPGTTRPLDRVVDLQQLVLQTTAGEVRPIWLSRRSAGGSPGFTLVDLPPFGPIVTDINQLLEYGKSGETAKYRALTWVPLLAGGGFALFGLLALIPFASSNRNGMGGRDSGS